MSDDERVLRSFVADDEAWLGSWTVTQVKRSKGRIPPSPAGEETVAITDERVLWFPGELADVAREDVEEVDGEYVEQQAAPPIVMAGGLLLVVGLFASVGAYLANAGGTLVVAMPALTGVGAYLATRLFADLTDREGETREGHRLRLSTGDGPVTIWGHDEATMAELRAAVGGESAPADRETSSDDAADGGDATDSDGTPDAETPGGDA